MMDNRVLGAPSNSTLKNNKAVAFASSAPTPARLTQKSKLVPYDQSDVSMAGWIPEHDLQQVHAELERTSRMLRASVEQNTEVDKQHTAKIEKLHDCNQKLDAEVRKLREELREARGQITSNETPDVDAVEWTCCDDDVDAVEWTLSEQL